jgi:hypothetical protein
MNLVWRGDGLCRFPEDKAMSKIKAVGYLLADNDAIWGVGATEDAAWDDLRAGKKAAGVPHESEVDTDDTYCPKYWTEDQFTAMPATAALLTKVEARGGLIAWTVVGNVACTEDEAEEAEG